MMNLRIDGGSLYYLIGDTFSRVACYAIVKEMENRPSYTIGDICMMFYECDESTAEDEELDVIQKLTNGKVLCWAS